MPSISSISSFSRVVDESLRVEETAEVTEMSVYIADDTPVRPHGTGACQYCIGSTVVFHARTATVNRGMLLYRIRLIYVCYLSGESVQVPCVSSHTSPVLCSQEIPTAEVFETRYAIDPSDFDLGRRVAGLTDGPRFPPLSPPLATRQTPHPL